MGALINKGTTIIVPDKITGAGIGAAPDPGFVRDPQSRLNDPFIAGRNKKFAPDKALAIADFEHGYYAINNVRKDYDDLWQGFDAPADDYIAFRDPILRPGVGLLIEGSNADIPVGSTMIQMSLYGTDELNAAVNGPAGITIVMDVDIIGQDRSYNMVYFNLASTRDPTSYPEYSFAYYMKQPDKELPNEWSVGTGSDTLEVWTSLDQHCVGGPRRIAANLGNGVPAYGSMDGSAHLDVGACPAIPLADKVYLMMGYSRYKDPTMSATNNQVILKRLGIYPLQSHQKVDDLSVR